MKFREIFKITSCMGVGVLVVGVSFNEIETSLLPQQPTANRTVSIQVTKGPIVFGTSREYALNEVIHVVAISSIFVIIGAIGVGRKFGKK